MRYVEIAGSLGTLRGMIHPAQGAKASWVVIVHGYLAANKIGPNRLYVQLAESLAIAGHSVLRIDLSAMGESDGDVTKLRFAHHVADVEAALKHVARLSQAPIDLLTHCAGCYVGAQVALNSTSLVRALTMLSPILPTDKQLRHKLLGSDAFDRLMRDGHILRKGVYFDRSFADAGQVLNRLAAQAGDVHIPIRVAIPEYDEFGDSEETVNWTEGAPLQFALIARADHNYLTSNSRQLLINQVVEWLG